MIDITKILELLETTPEAKLQTAKREFSPISVSATESANTILNKELGLGEEELPVARVSKPNIKRKAVEDITVTTPAVAFPETITFDEEDFAADYGIEVETLSAAYVEASEDGEIPEHIDVSFDFEETKIILSITSDGEVKETVNGEFIEPAQFIGRFEDRENEDGTVDNLLVLDLVEEIEDTNSDIGSEEDSITKSEGDEDHINEDGAQVTDEFIEEAGLGEDEYFAKNHSLEVSKNPANRLDPIDGTSRASESLAARTTRTYSKSAKEEYNKCNYRVYELDNNYDEVDCRKVFIDLDRAIKWAETRPYPTHIVESYDDSTELVWQSYKKTDRA